MLEVDGLETYYGASQALHGVGFVVRAGEMATLLGRNGMGKTTTVRSIAGLVPPRAGRVVFRGEPIERRPADWIGRRGLGLVPEGRQVFRNLTVDEHLRAWADNRSGTSNPWTPARVYRLFPRLAERRDHLGSQLSGGEQQMLAIGRVLATNPHLIVLDEATEGLAPLVRREIWDCLAALKAEGMAILVIDKYVRTLVRLADRHTIIERGRVAWQGASSELAGREDLWHRYLGV
ncbi:MAG: ABC transporter ATP-binding protein [Burkholderiales bacterium]